MFTRRVLPVLIASTLTTPLISTNTYSAAADLLEEVIITAQKKSQGELIQEVPIAITAFNGDQLDALQVNDLQDLTFSIPNVSLDDIGTTRGTANFTIRGLGINSSIPSIDPTVGVFVDGMYLGINSGVITDIFDLEGIEVLRGPQGLLFGRNVTGGAVLIKSQRPTQEFQAKFKTSVETGLDTTVAGTVSGSLIDDVLSARVTAYHRNDEGWHENDFNDNDDFGENRTRVLKAAFLYTPTEDLEFLLRYEYGEADGDGPAGQDRGTFSRDSFDFSIDEEGFARQRWDQVILETNWNISENGTLTNIAGYREYRISSLGDIDASPFFVFHSPALLDQRQFSNELRYAFSTDAYDLTVGAYYFTQNFDYFEQRLLPVLPGPFQDLTGGGRQDQNTVGVFAQGDIKLSDDLSLILGLRYTREEKDADVATILLNTCDLSAESCAAFNFSDDESWTNVTPKVGINWNVRDNFLVYGFWTKGFRSGGFNVRSTEVFLSPGPFDEEEQDTFEIGFKSDWSDKRIRLNGSVFFNEIKDLQREINTPGTLGVSQFITNSADATIVGIETELQYLATENFLISASFAYTDGEYDDVTFDLNSDGVVNSADEDLDIPRLTRFTSNVSATYDIDLGDIGALSTRVSFSHRDPSAYTDNNLGTLNGVDIFDAGITYNSPDQKVSVSVYGKNLTDKATAGGDTQLPAAFPSSTFSPLNEGRVYGVSFTYAL